MQHLRSKYPFAKLSLLCIFFAACSTGYQKENGNWVWVDYNENVGKKVTWITGVDNSTFRVLKDEKFAADRQQVYLKGIPIPGADPATFEVLHRMGYARDKNHAFLDRERVLFADPATFQVLDFPYARDARYIFCGTLPIPDLSPTEVDAFRLTNTDQLMATSKSITMLAHFIEHNPQYQWLDTMNGIQYVILGNQGTGETLTKKFKGYKVVSN